MRRVHTRATFLAVADHDDIAERAALARKRWVGPLPSCSDAELVERDEHIEATLAAAPPLTQRCWDELGAALGVRFVRRSERTRP